MVVGKQEAREVTYRIVHNSVCVLAESRHSGGRDEVRRDLFLFV